jgi:hypothetical protein
VEVDPATAGAVVVIATNLLVAVVAVAALRASTRAEARRIQPRVRARLHPHVPHWPEVGGARFPIYLTNDGTGRAFNVRYGVRLDGVEYPAGGGRGNRHNVNVGESIAPVMIDVRPYGPTRNETRARAVFYARFQDVTGAVWETHNPADLQADTTIRRVRFPRMTEWKQRRRRSRRTREEERAIAAIRASWADPEPVAPPEPSPSSEDEP